jgi:hypothetical protein
MFEHMFESVKHPAGGSRGAASNEAEPDQLDVAWAEGGAYARALEAMDEESGAVNRRAGDYQIAVADAADGRFVPGLDIRLTLLEGDRELFSTTMPFLWHPYLYHYGTNAKVPGEGPYTVRVRIDPPTWMRHDPVNGRRYERPVDVVFEDRRFTPGRKPSPDAQPRGADSSYAGR